ncbi:KilA-N domain-containing protein [Pseudomonas marincola]|uniref:KilA-N domain-containing protein n=1 Tax=Pseudomonas marincola TaxID=437900 RepID=UPI0008E21C60|nr:KilA-N domain-containing protein [Pseudomonas marincola]SFU11524.1 KilA-N domain-containing protein [Pseudomonas marincola]
MSSITVSAHGTTLLAIDEQTGYFNASLLTRQNSKNPKEFLCTFEAYSLLNAAAATLGESINEKWQDLQYVRNNKPQYFDALKDAKVIIGYAGTPGMRVSPGKNIAGSIPDYQPGLWLHPYLAAPFVRWMEPSSYTYQKSTLAPLVDQALEKYQNQPVIEKPVCEIAHTFSGLVTPEEMEQIKVIDRMLIEDGASDNERYQLINDRVDLLIQARES